MKTPRAALCAAVSAATLSLALPARAQAIVTERNISAKAAFTIAQAAIEACEARLQGG